MRPASINRIDAQDILYGDHQRRSKAVSRLTALWPEKTELDLEQLLLPDYCQWSGPASWIGSNLSWMARRGIAPKAWLPQLPFDEESETYGEPINYDWVMILRKLEAGSGKIMSDLYQQTHAVSALGVFKIPPALELIQLQVNDTEADTRANVFPLKTRVPRHQAQAVEELVGIGEWRYMLWEDGDDAYNLLILFDQDREAKGVVSMR